MAQPSYYFYRLDSKQSERSDGKATEDLLASVLEARGIKRAECCDGCVVAIANSFHAFLGAAAQHLNHCPGSFILTHKHHCAWTLRESRFLPESFVLPNELHSLKVALDAADDGALFILKPRRAGGGRLVRVVRRRDVLTRTEEYKNGVVVSRYIHNPLLLHGGRKFDLRLYVLVVRNFTEGFIFSEGIVRLASEPFSTADLSAFVHITNNQVQRRNGDVVVRNLTLSGLWRRVPKAVLWPRIRELVSDALVRARPAIVKTLHRERPRATCHALFGFDVVVNDALHPFLCEVNSMPTLGVGDEDVDLAVDRAMARCMYDLVLGFHGAEVETEFGVFESVYTAASAADCDED